MNRQKNLIRNTFILFFGTVFPRITSFITLPIITLVLTKNELGIYELVNTLMSFCIPIVTLQLHTSIFRFIIEKRDNLDEIKSIVTTSLIFEVPFSICILNFIVFMTPIFNSISFKTKILVIIYFFVEVIVNNVMQIIRGIGENKVYSFMSLVQSLSNVILIVFFLKVYNYGVNGLLLSLILSLTISIIVGSLIVHIYRYINLKFIRISILKDMLSYSLPLIPNGVSAWIVSLSDRLLVTFFLGLEATAVYSIANKIPSILNMIQNTFSYAWQENASLAVNDNDVVTYFSSVFKNIFIFLTCSIMGIICLSPLLFKLLIKGDYSQAYIHMIILLFSVFFSSLAYLIGGIYIAHKKSKEVGITTFFTSILNIVINITLIKFLGLYAASLSTLISYIFLFVFRLINVQKIQTIKFEKKEIAFNIGLIIFMLILCSQRIYWLDFFNCIITIFVIYYYYNQSVYKILQKCKPK